MIPFAPLPPLVVAVQTGVVALFGSIGDATIGAIIGGLFLTANTVLTLYLTKVLSRSDPDDRRTKRRAGKEGDRPERKRRGVESAQDPVQQGHPEDQAADKTPADNGATGTGGVRPGDS